MTYYQWQETNWNNFKPEIINVLNKISFTDSRLTTEFLDCVNEIILRQYQQRTIINEITFDGMFLNILTEKLPALLEGLNKYLFINKIIDPEQWGTFTTGTLSGKQTGNQTNSNTDTANSSENANTINVNGNVPTNIDITTTDIYATNDLLGYEKQANKLTNSKTNNVSSNGEMTNTNTTDNNTNNHIINYFEVLTSQALADFWQSNIFSNLLEALSVLFINFEVYEF